MAHSSALPPTDDAKFYANGFRLKPKVIYCCQWAPSKMLLHIHYAQMYAPLSCFRMCPLCICIFVCHVPCVCMRVCVLLWVCIKIVAENIKPPRSKLKTCIEIKLAKRKTTQNATKQNEMKWKALPHVWQLFCQYPVNFKWASIVESAANQIVVKYLFSLGSQVEFGVVQI